MVDTRLLYSNEDKAVVLGIHSKLTSIGDDACKQVWRVIEAANIKGTFVLFVNKKIVGQSNTNTAVKVVGTATNNPHHLYLKFQSSAGECYEGSLSLRLNGSNDMEYASRLRDKLKTVTGDGWFNPDVPQVKKVAPPLVRTDIPIARVETALYTAATTVIMTPPRNGYRHTGRLSKLRSVANVLVPITTAAVRYKRLMNIRSDIADLEAKKSKIEQKITALQKKAQKQILLDAEKVVITAGVKF